MSVSGSRSNKYLCNGLNAVLGSFLLVLYLIGNNQFNTVHELVHARESGVVHSTEDELQPCHRSIYHEKGRQSCDHKTHVATPDRCDLCHAVVATEQVGCAGTSCQDLEFPASPEDRFPEIHAFGISTPAPSRAPPIA